MKFIELDGVGHREIGVPADQVDQGDVRIGLDRDQRMRTQEPQVHAAPWWAHGLACRLLLFTQLVSNEPARRLRGLD